MLFLQQNPTMHLAGKQSQSFRSSQLGRLALHNLNNQPSEIEDSNDEGWEGTEQESFSMSISARKQPSARRINPSMVNLSCINTLNHSCRNLDSVPAELIQNSSLRLSGVQKLDLSFNSISSLEDLSFEKFSSLKELMLNDNQINSLPYHSINRCKLLRILNISHNQLKTLPPISSPNYILARGNPLQIISSQFRNIDKIEFINFDWLDYLVDSVSSQISSERFKDYSREYSDFKKSLLEKIDYSKQENCSYCDFHCLFSLRVEQLKSRKEGPQSLIGAQTARAILKGDQFFLHYLKNYHNTFNFAGLTYNSRLLLQLALQSGRSDAIDLFKMRKQNYSEGMHEQIYFESLRICCKHSNIELFKYLLHIESKRKLCHTQTHIATLIKDLVQRYNKEKQSDQILTELFKIWKKITKAKLVLRLPVNYNHRQFRSMSSAVLDILQKDQWSELTVLEPENEKTTTLHFALRSRNEQLVKKFLDNGQAVFQADSQKQGCRFTQGATQVSRKMIWKKEKKILKQLWGQSQIQAAAQKSQLSMRSKTSGNCLNSLVASRVGYQNLQIDFMIYRKPLEERLVFKNYAFDFDGRKKRWKDEEVLPQLKAAAKVAIQSSWKNQYLKKIISYDIVAFLLWQIEGWEQEDYLLRIQKWGKAIDSFGSLMEIFEGSKDSLLAYEVIHTASNLMGEQNHHGKSIKGGNFWCCQNVAYD